MKDRDDVTTIDFYFDFISPYAYLASTRIDALAMRHGAVVRWHAFRLGVAVVKVMGLKPLMETPLKNDYVARDIVRLAAVMGEPLASGLTQPDPMPPARLFHAVPPEHAGHVARTLLHARWARGLDIGQPSVLEGLASELGLTAAAVSAALADPATREAWTAATRAALDLGVFGSPTCAVGRELFWGTDRMELLARYLASGGRYMPATNTCESEFAQPPRSVDFPGHPV